LLKVLIILFLCSCLECVQPQDLNQDLREKESDYLSALKRVSFSRSTFEVYSTFGNWLDFYEFNFDLDCKRSDFIIKMLNAPISQLEPCVMFLNASLQPWASNFSFKDVQDLYQSCPRWLYHSINNAKISYNAFIDQLIALGFDGKKLEQFRQEVDRGVYFNFRNIFLSIKSDPVYCEMIRNDSCEFCEFIGGKQLYFYL
jgi:hypothetical protein